MTCTAGALAVTTAGQITPAGAVELPAAGAVGLPAAVAVGRSLAVARTGGIPINIRTGPALSYPRGGTAPDGRRLAVSCQVRGQHIAGYARTTDVWDRLADGRYVSDANVAWYPRTRPPRWCSGGGRPAPRPVNRAATADTGGIPLNLRAGPSTGQPKAGTVPDGTRLAVVCQVRGQDIAGHVRRTDLWDRLSSGRYVSDAYLRWQPSRPALPGCAAIPRPAVPGPVAPRPVAPDPVAPDPATFIARLAVPARESMRRHGVPASVTIAQAILESGWGRSELAYGDHNYFGIKCFGGPGPVAVGCRNYPTSECAGLRCFPTREAFRVYATLADSVYDHGRFLAVDNPRYRPAFAYTSVPDRFAVAIHRAGYATSPGYARAVIGLMRQYGLYRYDR